MKHLSYLLLCALAFVTVSCTSPEEEGARIANELVQAQTTLRNGRLEILNTFLEKFDPARFLDRKSARESLDTQLEEKMQQYEAKRLVLEEEFELMKKKYADNNAKLTAFEEAYHKIVLNAPAMVSEQEMPLKSSCEEIILSIVPPAPTTIKISQDLIGREFMEDCENGYFPEHKWNIEGRDMLDVEIIECNEKPDSCLYKVIATINKPSVASWIAELDIRYALGDSDEWDFDTLTCSSVMPQVTDTINESVTHQLVGNESNAQLIITNISDKKVVVGGATNKGTDDEWYRFSVFLDPKATTTIEGEDHTPALDYKIDFVELGD